MTEAATSKNGVPIRHADERWSHIMEEHAELAAPERILAGSAGEFLALRKQNKGKTLVVGQREAVGDGFVITAFLTRCSAGESIMAVTEIAEFLKIVPTVQRTPHKYLWWFFAVSSGMETGWEGGKSSLWDAARL